MIVNQRNQFDNDGCLERGNTAESRFNFILNKKGYQTHKSSTQEDINQHWDYSFIYEGKEIKVDVKGMKKLSRNDNNVQDEWHWIELHSVRESDEGWLYNGHSHWIAFETTNTFIIVERLRLIELVDQLVDKNNRVYTAAEAKYKVYQRQGRPDLITLVESSRLREINLYEWEK